MGLLQEVLLGFVIGYGSGKREHGSRGARSIGRFHAMTEVTLALLPWYTYSYSRLARRRRVRDSPGTRNRAEYCSSDSVTRNVTVIYHSAKPLGSCCHPPQVSAVESKLFHASAGISWRPDKGYLAYKSTYSASRLHSQAYSESRLHSQA